MDKLESVPQLNPSQLSLILDHPTFGFHPKNADFPLLVIFINIMTVLRAQPTLLMELNSILHMDLVLLSVSSVKIQQLLLVLRLKNLSLDKSLSSKVSLS